MIKSSNGLPLGIEVLIKKAAVDPVFRRMLLVRRDKAAEAIGLKLTPAEEAMLGAITAEQLRKVIEETEIPEESRRVFMGQAAAAMLAALGLGATGCGHEAARQTASNAVAETEKAHKQQKARLYAEREMATGRTSKGLRPDQIEIKRLLINAKPIYFDINSAEIRADQVEQLEKNARILQSPAVARKAILLEGHADESGTPEYIFKLGERRANAVRDYLIRMGVDGSRLSVISRGNAQLVNPGLDETARAENRRVEMTGDSKQGS